MSGRVVHTKLGFEEGYPIYTVVMEGRSKRLFFVVVRLCPPSTIVLIISITVVTVWAATDCHVGRANPNYHYFVSIRMSRVA